MSTISRRIFMLSAAALPVGCALRRPSVDTTLPAIVDLRPPAAGQSWRYTKSDAISGAFVDNQADVVTAVGSTVSIDSHNENATDSHAGSSWGVAWLDEKFASHRPAAPLAAEVQMPWGMVLVDPRWSETQVFESPIPLWPAQLTEGWRAHVNTRYKTASHEGNGLAWDQSMTAHGWESITVPAGRFTVLRFTNLINFVSSDVSRTASTRRETIWFAPQIGRWVARESSGTYYLTDSVVDQPYNEPSFRWELLAWT